jgi:hypothetical protein
LRVRLGSSGQRTYAGDGTSGVYIGNVQLNTGQPVGMIEVGATRAASVVWRGGTAAEIDYAAQAAAAEPHHHRRRFGRGNPDRRRERGGLSMIIRKIGGGGGGGNTSGVGGAGGQAYCVVEWE